MNVWKELDQSRNARFGNGGLEQQIESELIDAEYQGTEKYAMPCPSGDGTMEYRATVGVLMCPSCRQMAHMNGELIGKGSGRTPEFEGGADV